MGGKMMINTDADGDLDLQKINEHDDTPGVANYHRLYRPGKGAQENDVETNYLDSNV